VSVLSIRDASLTLGRRQLWSGLQLEIERAEFVAVLGPNGSGKTSLLRAILGQQELTSGSVELLGEPARRGNPRVGYVPQQKLIAAGTPLRARDLVTLGVDGHRWGLPLPSGATRRRVDELLAAVGATQHANSPVATLSGGEQQRIRIAQAIASDPAILLCDEPLLSLDLAHQRSVSELIDEQRRLHGTSVLFVTHDINPILGMVDRVLYLAGGKFTIGSPDEVLRTDVLTALYGTPVDVLRSRGRVVVVGGPGEEHHAHHDMDESRVS
jgi:zinc/manganese transport system ATP-binding protein